MYKWKKLYKMRLSTYEIEAIKDTFKKVFRDGKIYLFGSRVDESKKGGDIDLFLDLPYKLETRELIDKKSQFKLSLYERIGEQKIDVVISKDKDRSIEREALKTGVLL